MATNRYWAVRREIYAYCSNVKLSKYRSFQEIKQLFTRGYWVLLIGMVICLGAFVGSFYLPPKYSFIAIVSVVGIFVISAINEFLGDRLYHPDARQKEIEEQAVSLDSYISESQRILVSHGIENKASRNVLRQECEERLAQNKKRPAILNNRTADVLIGIFFGVLISTIASESDSTDTALLLVASLLVAGIAIVGIVRMVKKIKYYSDGYFKDQLLLNVLDELSYIP